MIKEIFAYIIAFFLSPTIAGFMLILVAPLGLLIIKVFKFLDDNAHFKQLFIGLNWFVVGFANVWVAAFIFSWFDVQPTLLLVIILGLSLMNNGLNRVSRAQASGVYDVIILSEKVGVVSGLLGIVVGGIYIL